MKCAIIFYSYTGNTKKVAEILREYLQERSEVEFIELKAKESDKFLIQAIRAFKHKKAQIQAVNFDLSKFELICLGTPVWAFSPAPAMNTFLERCFGLENKQILLFATYGSGVGKERALDYMQEILKKKGAKIFKRILIQEKKTNDKNFVLAQIKDILEK